MNNKIKKTFSLKFKSFVYRYFGIYLAYKQELDYIDSKDYWKSFMKIAKNPKNDMSPRDIHGLLIGSWQCNHNFARQFTLIDPRKRPRFFWGTIRWFSVLFSTILWDLQYLYKKIKLK